MFRFLLDEFHERRVIALPGFLLNKRHQALDAVHFALRGFLQAAAKKTLQRFNENDEKKQKNRRGRFRRQDGSEPLAYAAHERQVEESDECGGHRVEKIFLTADIQKIMSLDEIDERNERRQRHKRQCERQSFPALPGQPKNWEMNRAE